MSEIIEQGYCEFLTIVKDAIRQTQQKAVSSVNTYMLLLYFKIGQMIDAKQNELGWGAKVIDKLSLDIKNELPQIKGFSTRNIKRMLAFFKEYQYNTQVVPQLVAQNDFSQMPQGVAQMEMVIFQIPWGHNILDPISKQAHHLLQTL
jgi:hypothetical protein